MNVSKLFPAFALLALIVAPVMADERQEAEERCKVFAQEDGVTEQEMAGYMQQCVEELTAPVPGEEEPAPAQKS